MIFDKDQEIYSQTDDIYNAFYLIFVNIVKNFATRINHTDKIKNHKGFVGPRQHSSIVLNLTDEFEVWQQFIT